MSNDMEKMIIRQIFPERNPILYSQVLNLRNQVLRLPIGLDLFQEDLSQEVNHVILAAITTTVEAEAAIVAKSNDNNSSNNPNGIDSHKSKTKIEPVLLTGGEEQIIVAEQNLQEGKVVGCIVLAPIEGDDKTLKIRQMAVSPHLQGQGVGSKLVQSAEDYAKREGKTKLYLHGRAHAVGFYQKAGYTKLTEKEFLELGIPHHTMEKLL